MQNTILRLFVQKCDVLSRWPPFQDGRHFGVNFYGKHNDWVQDSTIKCNTSIHIAFGMKNSILILFPPKYDVFSRWPKKFQDGCHFGISFYRNNNFWTKDSTVKCNTLIHIEFSMENAILMLFFSPIIWCIFKIATIFKMAAILV